ncbi:hypothetical protein BaRGS_00023107, partial [Batillaria attramentaria]
IDWACSNHGLLNRAKPAAFQSFSPVPVGKKCPHWDCHSVPAARSHGGVNEQT